MDDREAMRSSMESVGNQLGLIKDEIKRLRGQVEQSSSEKSISSLELRVKQLQGLIERLPRQGEGESQQMVLARLRELQATIALLAETVRRIEEQRRAMLKKRLSLTALLVVALTLFLGGGFGGMMLQRWLQKSDPSLLLDQSAEMKLILGELLIEQCEKMDEEEREIVKDWLSGDIELPFGTRSDGRKKSSTRGKRRPAE